MKHKYLWTLLLIFAGIGVCLLSGCASRKAMNKLFYDLGKATGKVEAMNYGR